MTALPDIFDGSTRGMKQTGVLRVTGGGQYDFWPDDGKPIEAVVNACDAPTDTHIAVEINGRILTAFEETGAMFGAGDGESKRIALMALVRTEAEDTPERRASIARIAKDVEVSLRVNCGHIWDITVRGCVVVDNQPWSLTGFSYRADHVARQIAEQHPGFEPNYWHGYGGFHPQGYAGVTYIGGRFGMTFGNGRIPGTMVHEILHQFGGGHSTSPHNEYGDNTCSLAQARGLNACKHILFGGAESSSDLGEHFIVPLETPDEAVMHGEVKAVYVATPVGWHILSARKTSAQHVEGVSGDADSVHVHQFTNGGLSSVKSTIIGAVPAGDSDLFGGVDVVNYGATLGAIHCRVDSGHDSEMRERPRLALTGDQFDPAGGIYHDQRYGLQGLDLHKTDGGYIGYFFGHTARGRVYPNPIDRLGTAGQVWYQIHFDVQADHANLAFYGFRNGDFGQVGEGVAAMIDGKMRMVYWTPEHGRDCFGFEPLAIRKDHETNGLWETGEMEGFTLGRYHGHHVGYWFGRDERDQPIWRMLDGQLDDMAAFQPAARHKSFARLSTGEPEHELGNPNMGATFANGQFAMDDNTSQAVRVF